ncbi:HAMP domain-containing protein, partial [Georgenia ruanii]|nr:HAMP domain-containing protein [Georgenia ruanii]
VIPSALGPGGLGARPGPAESGGPTPSEPGRPAGPNDAAAGPRPGQEPAAAPARAADAEEPEPELVPGLVSPAYDLGSIAHPDGPATTYRPRTRRSLRIRLRRKVKRLVRRWRTSLSVRVVSVTVVGGFFALALLGGVLSGQIRDRLYDQRVDQMLEDAALRARDAQQAFDSAVATTAPQVQSIAADWITKAQSAATAGAVGAVLMRSPEAASSVTFAEPATNGAVRELVTPALRRAVQGGGGQHWQPVGVPMADGEAPGIVVGAPVTLPAAGAYELYIVYTLEPEEQTIGLVIRILAVGAVGLVLLLAALAWLISRWVLRPVRDAAYTAERIADGLLDERMDVRGHDELALLGESFNEMAASLQRQIEQMEELSRLQQRFVSDVSHELRTPLTTIRMASEVIHDNKDAFDPVVRRSAELLQAQLDRFEAMLADLLEISRFDAGAAVLDCEERDLRDVVTRVVEMSAILAERKGSAVRVDTPEGTCTADIDARRIERVLRNLVVNAIEHGEGRPIDITVRCTPGAVAVRVLDHGVGMSEEAAGHVFDRFWRADPARARTTGGTGLGLSIAMEDTRLHGGTLEATGRQGVGSSFLLTLPRRAGAAVGRPPVALWPEEAGTTADAGSVTAAARPVAAVAPAAAGVAAPAGAPVATPAGATVAAAIAADADDEADR